MKKQTKRLLQFLAATAALAGLDSQATEIDLHLKPDIQSPKVGRVSLDDPRLGQPAPVLDEAKAALGWNFADYSGSVEAWVPDAKIGKDLLPVDNAILYAGPSENSTLLGTYRFGQPLEVIDTGPWWKVRYGGGVPVYFVLDTPPPIPAVTGSAALPPATAGTPAPAPLPAPRFEDPTISDAAYGQAEPGSTVPQVDPQERARPAVIGQSYEGVFRQSKRALGIIKPKSPFYLEGGNGRRIAWVDVSDIVIPGSIKDFLDKEVVLHGERDLVSPKSGEWIILARNMRLK